MNNSGFIREFIQNSLDASKIQLWRDLNNDIYNHWIVPGKELRNLTPFDIPKEIYDNYAIEVGIEEKDDDNIEVRIRDRGIGISIHTLKAMCDVGNSYTGKLELRKDLSEMPSWLKPTAGFGIGLQSGFLVVDKFKAYSKTDGNNTIEIIFESRKKGNGYIQVRNSEKNIKRGTEFYLQLKKSKDFKYNLRGHVAEYLKSAYDPILNDNLLVYKIVDLVIDNCKENIIPININNKDKKNSESNILNLFDSKRIEQGNYIYNISDNFDNMDLWIKDKSIYLKIQMKTWDYNRNASYKVSKQVVFSYKGIKLNKEIRNMNFWTSMDIDIYGKSANELLKLNRDEFTKDGKKYINKIITEGNEFYIQKLKEKIDELGEESKAKEFDKFGFIMLASMIIKDFKASDYNFLLDEKIKIQVMKKIDDSFKNNEIPFLRIIDVYPNLTYININKFIKNDKVDYASIENELKENINDIKEDIIIVDKNFIDILEQFLIRKIQCIDSKSNRNTLLYSINENNDMIVVNEKTENYLIELLVLSEKDKPNYGIWYSEYQRNCIPTFSKYDLLAIKTVPSGIDFYKYNIRQMISPITRKDKGKIKSFNDKESFIESIIVREDYRKLLDYTIKNRNSEKITTIEEIDNLYKELIGKYFELMKKKLKSTEREDASLN